MPRLLPLLAALLFVLSACSKSEDPARRQPPKPTAQYPYSGKVVQTLPASGYTYAEVELPDGAKAWIAGAAIEVKAGEYVQWGDAAIMRNFNSRALNRSFEQILFVNSWAPAGGQAAAMTAHGTGQPPVPLAPGAAGAAAPHPPMAMPGAGHPPMGGAAPAGANEGRVRSVANAGGYTYLELEQGGQSLWLAVAETPVKTGDTVRWDGGTVMQNFTAKSLNRTFERIVFAGGISVVK